MKIIGLTGGIASGKSLVQQWFIDENIPVIDADLVYKQLSKPGGMVYNILVQIVSNDCILPEGTLNWKCLGQLLFSNEEFRLRLNKAVHPLVQEEMLKRLERLRIENKPLAIVSVPLLYESGFNRYCDKVICVYVRPEVQLERLKTRDGIDETYAKTKILAQLPLEQKRSFADFVIDNSGSQEQSRVEFQLILASLRSE
ncbi:MAG: dephospho-CoA kinase [Candidatus Izemoplasmatales bacterium]|jgi:dephospho-CoA kinase